MKEQDKQAYFATHWGCMYFDTQHKEELRVNSAFVIGLQYAYLILKSVDSISDEDLLKVAQRLRPHDIVSHAWVEKGKIYFKRKGNYPNSKYTTHNEFLDGVWTNTRVADYLRSQGYLIQFRDYTAEQLISMGWAKITESWKN